MTAQALYRNLLRQAKQVTDYNFRSYSIRRVKTGFRKNQQLQGDEAAAAIQDGHVQLEVLKRQVILGKLYPGAASVMDSPNPIIA
ncbi:unnamed protein product [Cylindrotheca closterium]|uniref:Complex 1 LYR protein domain-containing protein n=1 Tax=Cylindrotheca closterium TaxID=2856 RepID=A0AAD2FV41_9STRA|nr:unnamed protein product [Cylindrotheca closterium]